MSLYRLASGDTMLAESSATAIETAATGNTNNQFLQYFRAFLAITAQQKQQVFQLRHQVYCEELQFEPCRGDGLETDNYDNRSLLLAVHRHSAQQLAGTVRLITSTSADEPLPLENYCADNLSRPELAPANFNRRHICEISRLAVPASIRSRNQPQLSELNRGEASHYADVAIALYLMAQIFSLRTLHYHTYVMIEPALARALRRVGIAFVQIGPAVNLNGQRAPHYLDARSTAATLKPQYLQLRNALEQQLLGQPGTHKPALTLCYSAAG